MVGAELRFVGLEGRSAAGPGGGCPSGTRWFGPSVVSSALSVGGRVWFLDCFVDLCDLSCVIFLGIAAKVLLEEARPRCRLGAREREGRADICVGSCPWKQNMFRLRSEIWM